MSYNSEDYFEGHKVQKSLTFAQENLNELQKEPKLLQSIVTSVYLIQEWTMVHSILQ